MEALRLVRPTIELAEEIAAYRQEFLDDGSSMDGAGALRRLADPAEWLAHNELLSHPETAPANWVQSTQFVCVRERDGRLVGMLQVRHCFNEYLEKYAGNIGYSVRGSERRKGYATRMLRESLPFCRQIGLPRVLVSCLRENEASRRTILANGGIYESAVLEPRENVWLERYWITL